MRADDEPVVVEQTFNVSIDRVWTALTQVDEMRQWYFDNIPAFEPVIGFETQFDVESDGRHFLHMWKVTEAIPNKVIQYDWRYEGYAGDAFVVFELFEEGELTRLRLTCTARESFPEEIPEFTRENCVGGWNYFLQDQLKEYLEPEDSE